MKILQLDNTLELNNKITWNSNWLSPFESPWGIIEKIKFANEITSREFMKICGTEEVKRIKTKLGYSHRGLFSLRSIDDDVFYNYFGFSIKKHNSELINQLCRPFFDGEKYFYNYFHKDLYICPVCIQGGFHSLFHQFNVLDTCPFHKVNLIEACKQCTTRYQNDFGYEMTNRASSPFHCNCGDCLIPDYNKLFPIWYKPGRNNILLEDIIRWLSLSDEELSTLRGTFYLDTNENYLPFQHKLLNNMIGILTENKGKCSIYRKTNKNHYRKDYKKMDLKYYFLSILTNEEYKDSYDAIFLSTRKTISSISRKIRKEVYAKHRNCLKRMKEYLKTSYEQKLPFCPVAYAYLQARHEVQGFGEFREVDKRRYVEDRKYVSGFDIGTNIDRDLIFYMIEKMISSNSFYNDIPSLIWKIQRVISELYLFHFKNILEKSSNEEKILSFNNYYNNIYEKLHIIIVKSIEDKEEFILPTDNTINLKNIINQYSSFCPYKSVRKRRIKSAEKSCAPFKLAVEGMNS